MQYVYFITYVSGRISKTLKKKKHHRLQKNH